MFKYNVMTEEEALSHRFSLLEDGEYDAVVVSSEDRLSSKGSPMMDMKIAVYPSKGTSLQVRDFLVFTDKMMWKVINFAKSANVFDTYEGGALCSEKVIGKNISVKVTTEEGSLIPEDKLNGKPEGSRYPAKNKIVDYLTQSDLTKLTSSPP